MPCRRSSSFRTAPSPTSPVTSVTSLGTAQENPVERSSSTTTVSPASDELQNHVAADIAGASRNQNRHRRVLLAPQRC